MGGRRLAGAILGSLLFAGAVGTTTPPVGAADPPDPFAGMVIDKLGPFDQSGAATFLGEATLCTETVAPPSARELLVPEIPSMAGVMPAPLHDFVGVTNKDQKKLLPPPTKDLPHEDGASDTSGAVGPNHYMEVVNDAVEVFSKDGDLLCGPYPNDYWWHGTECQVQGVLTDAVIEYDQAADRWMAGHFAGSGHLCMAVSQGPDPTAGYWLYEFSIWPSDSQFQYAGDYPKFGIWPDAYYYVSNARTPSGGALDGFDGTYLAAFDRQAMLCGAPCVSSGSVGDVEYVLQFTKNGQQATFESLPFTMLPSNADGTLPPPSGAPDPIVQSSSAGTGDTLTVWDFHADFADTSASSLEPEGSLTVAPYSAPCGVGATGYIIQDCLTQPIPAGSTQRRQLDALGRYLMNRGVYRNFGDHASLLVDQTIATGVTLPEHLPQTGIRWYELRNSDATPWQLFQQGTYAPDATSDRWLGSMSMDGSGDIAIGFNVSDGTSRPPSVAYVGRLAGDPPGTLPHAEVVAVPGRGAQTRGGEFGDYAQMTLDPADDCTFWHAGEFYQSQEDAGASPPLWATSVTAFRFPECTAHAAAPVSPAGSPVAEGSSSTRPPTLAATGGGGHLARGVALIALGGSLLLGCSALRRRCRHHN